MNKENILQGRTLTVGELKEILAEFPDETYVVTSHNYGDYSHTEAVKFIKEGNIQLFNLKDTAYSDTRLAVDTDDIGLEDPDRIKAADVLVL